MLSARGFTQVPNHVLRDPKLTAGAKLVYAMLLSYAWHNDFAFPGQDRMAAQMGVTGRSVITYTKELEKKNFLSITRRGQGKTNIYTLNLTTKKKRG
ncbi:MAG TPA: helix-turn-helix domain-containing protein [Acidobacteriota bacterium]|nr:helix-turn-helix domain-containing protein [Acidobacteriota bacterium]